ncbi:DUF4131 domain-containing protein [Candidatus Dependentiae bacterium]|nr:MAG: DUF4131 domain-containing protein [Candidatus Dependentiae bacterium]
MNNPWLRLNYSFFVTIILILGIWWQSQNYPLYPVLICLFGLFLIALLKRKKIQTIKLLLLFSVVFSLGYIRYQQQQYHFNDFYKKYSHNSYDLIGTILTIDTTAHTNFGAHLIVHIKQIKNHHNNEKWTDLNRKLSIYLQSAQSIYVADLIMIKNVSFKKPRSQSFSQYLIKENFAASIFLTIHQCKLINRPSYSFSRWLACYKKALINRLKQKLSPPVFKLFATIFLGNPTEKQKINEIKYAFKAWGIMHYLARSGLHLILFILLWHLLLRLFPISYKLRQFLLLGIVTIYSLLSWSSIPFVRALLIFVLYKLGALLHLQTNLLHLLAIICFITLLINPMQLFFLDFQLSFGLTASLAFFNVIHD